MKLTKQMQAMLDDAVSNKAKILEEISSLRIKETELQEKVDAISAELTAVRREIVSIERPGLVEATQVINVLSRKGDKGIKAEPGKFESEIS